MYDRILLPTDGSAVAEAATDAALALAERFGADLHVVHVLEFGDLPPGIEDTDEGELAHGGEAVTAAAAERARDAGLDVTTAVLEDAEATHRALLDYADEHGIDCIVMGTYGRSGLDRFVLGSVTEQTLRESPIPVLTVHEETVVDTDFDAILVPTDGSECAMAAAEEAIELAAATGAALHVVNVVDPGAVGTEGDVGMLLDALQQAGERAIEAVVDRAREAGVSTIEGSALSGTAYRAIVDYAEESEIDCIVMGTHGRTGIRRFLLGSVTERVVRLSDVPVLAVKDREEAAETFRNDTE